MAGVYKELKYAKHKLDEIKEHLDNAEADLNRTKLERQLVVGAKIKFGPKYAEEHGLVEPGQVIEIVEGSFENYNGLYETIEKAPAIPDDNGNDYVSIYHLFENDLSGFMDCEVLTLDDQIYPVVRELDNLGAYTAANDLDPIRYATVTLMHLLKKKYNI